MLDLLKLEGCAWAVIASCKGKKEDVKVLVSCICTLLLLQYFLQAFEKKVKNQFSLVPFEEVIPVVEQTGSY